MMTFGYISGAQTNTLLRSGYHGAMMHAVLDAAEGRRHNITIFNRSLLGNNLQRSIRFYCDGRCDGLIVTSPNMDSKLVYALVERGTPFVVTGASTLDANVPCADVANYDASMLVMDYLIRLGHRKIAHASGADFIQCVYQRRDGYRDAMANAKLSIDPEWEMWGFRNDDAEYQWLLDLFSLPIARRPTALYAWNDQVATKAKQAAEDHGLHVPEDISIVGFDDDPRFMNDHPGLTTVRQPYQEIGEAAVKILLAQIQRDSTVPKHCLLPGELIIRQSAMPPKE